MKRGDKIDETFVLYPAELRFAEAKTVDLNHDHVIANDVVPPAFAAKLKIGRSGKNRTYIGQLSVVCSRR